MNQKLKNFLLISAIYAFSILLAITLSPIGGAIHNSFWSSQGCWFWGPCDQGSITEGFIYFYVLFLSLLSFALLKQKTAWIIFLIGSILLWVGIILIIATEGLKYLRNEEIGTLAIMICMFALGWLLVQGGLMVYKKLKK